DLETPGFSPFAITGVTQEESVIQKSTLELVPEENLTNSSSWTGEQHESDSENAAGPDFRFILMLLACAFLVVRRRS
ncbi:MAG: hypothetical protein QG610_2066, partial [Euryarchaeota archaeon]|nr:hypothetical protein [Euryarchaeota archaeon]